MSNALQLSFWYLMAPTTANGQRQCRTTWCPMLRFDWTSSHYADTLDCYLFFPLYSLHRSPLYDMILWSFIVWYDLADPLGTIRADGSFMYDINLRATHTTILSIRGVMIPIDLVSSAADSIRRCVVLFKLVTIPTSDPKSEFLCQSSSSCAEPTDSPEHLVHLGYLPCPVTLL